VLQRHNDEVFRWQLVARCPKFLESRSKDPKVKEFTNE